MSRRGFTFSQKSKIQTYGKRKKMYFFNYFISVISNFSYMDFFRKCSIFGRSIPLTREFTKIKEDNTNIPTWWPTGRTVLLPKTKSLEDEKDYHPITCLNTPYKIMTGVVAKYMREHTMKNEIWDESQLGTVEGVLGTVDQLIIDRSLWKK